MPSTILLKCENTSCSTPARRNLTGLNGSPDDALEMYNELRFKEGFRWACPSCNALLTAVFTGTDEQMQGLTQGAFANPGMARSGVNFCVSQLNLRLNRRTADSNTTEPVPVRVDRPIKPVSGKLGAVLSALQSSNPITYFKS